MDNPTVGISILTNGARRPWLERCVSAFLENCHYRPLRIAIYNNGATDDTEEWINSLAEKEFYGVTWAVCHENVDVGMAHGTNNSIALVDYPPLEPTEFHLHLESDFIHMPEAMTGVDKFWLHRAIQFMQNGDCDYLYLRRQGDENEMMMHFWSQWMPGLEGDGEHLKCPNFWWSNNPALFRVTDLVNNGTLPLKAERDGAKGTPDWTKAEVGATRPKNPYLHHWGMFMHEVKEPTHLKPIGCGKYPAVGSSTCKYGFYKDGTEAFCQSCDLSKGREDMPAHEQRFRSGTIVPQSQPKEVEGKIALGTVITDESVFEAHLKGSLTNKLNDVMVIDGHPDVGLAAVYNRLMNECDGRFLILCHPDVEFSEDVYDTVRSELSKPEVGAVGMIGALDSMKQVWGTSFKEPKKVSSLDGCFIAIDTEKGLRFDEETFDGLHLYAEDLCFQARDQGLKVKLIPAAKFLHASTTTGQRNRVAWGNYWEYHSRLTKKWGTKFKIATT